VDFPFLERGQSHPTKKAWLFISQAKLTQNIFVIFGGLAVVVTCGDGRPIALRHRLSPVLPLSDVCNDYSIAMLTTVLAG
jgi:hypothetical protein